MAHIGQELGFCPACKDCSAARQVELGVADLDHLHALLHLARGLFDPLLQLLVAGFQVLCHDVETGLELAQLARGVISDAGIQLARLHPLHGAIDLGDRRQQPTQVQHHEHQCHRQPQYNDCYPDQRSRDLPAAEPHIDPEPDHTEQKGAEGDQEPPVVDTVRAIGFEELEQGYPFAVQALPNGLVAGDTNSFCPCRLSKLPR